MQGALELVGGIVAHNEEATIEASIRSLVTQEVGPSRWTTIWVVVSGCTDRTVERARTIAEEDARVQVIVQPERQGKSQALNAIFARAKGDALVLLNGDAVAEPGAVLTLLARAATATPPFAIMARPVPPPADSRGPFAGALNLLWTLHSELHHELLTAGGGNHVSDELLLLSLPLVGQYPPGTINDGAYMGAVLDQRGGMLGYAPEARVRIQVPATVAGHLRQRRRIYAGHARVTRQAGSTPTTLPYLAVRAPTRAWKILRRGWASDPHLDRWVVLLWLEAVAAGLALWDELPPRRDQARWRRVTATTGWDACTATESART